MRRHHSPFSVVKVALSLSLGIWVCGAPLVAEALKLPRRGLPGRREPAGSRDTLVCVAPKAKPLIALVPEQNRQITVSDYPTFFFYVPETIAKTAEFALADENYDVIYSTTLKLTGKPGVISVSLPKGTKLPPLQVGKVYIWDFALKCNPGKPNGDLYVRGLISRVPFADELRKQLNQSDATKHPEIYAGAGMWPETLASLSTLRRSDPRNPTLQKNWADLLESVNMADYSKEPLIDCCQPTAQQPRLSR
ncbi:MAG: DUF928 domain-containing protein [Leptolyngbyaceae cyanobacterium bins.59]|nr:DUF928 domain-containing protein [Leptolyngbyaceae cyanobacterium bins.59]